ncbi:hypothetical protein GQX74_015768 [Glossina fuscipes]|nr:hypothetical protein GQX74_015768 [Glossina fuscipes]
MHIGDVIILAVKPNIIPTVCSEIKHIENLSNKIIISVAAGINIEKINKYIGEKNTTIVRAMPNTPVLVNQGVIGLYAKKIHTNQKKFITTLFNKIGKTFWLSHENELNGIIAVASSAPAYFFLMMESMQNAAENMGLNKEYIKELIVQTAKGSSILAEHFQDKSFEVLKQHVISKGGTTEAALNLFEKYNFKKIIEKAMRSAANKSKEIESTTNQNKINELKEALYKVQINTVSQKNFKINNVFESAPTFIENALIKARNASKLGFPALADDSGLIIKALNGKPGVYSSRFCGELSTDRNNIEKVLQKMSKYNISERHAKLYCVLAYVRFFNDPTPIIIESSLDGLISTFISKTIIEAESNFNPRAISNSKALGLMQIVQNTAGRDVFKMQGKVGRPTKNMLLNPEKNIDIGTAYLSLLRDNYLSSINNPISKKYATIASYHGGVTAMLSVFSRDQMKAFQIINHLHPDDVYQYICAHHSSLESRRYLFKVYHLEKAYYN